MSNNTFDLSREEARIGNASQRLVNVEKAVNIFIRVVMFLIMIYLFVRSNDDVMKLINTAYQDDIKLKPDNRIITPNVMITLISATAAQVGISIVAIIKWLFPEKQ